MANEGYPQGDDYRPQGQDYGRDYGSGRNGSYSSAREYEAAGYRGGRGFGRADAGRDDFGGRYQRDDRFSDNSDYRGASEYRGSYGSGGRRFEEGVDRVGSDDRYRARDDGRDRDDRNDRARMRGGQGDDRGFIARAGDEVRSWFGDDDADRRRQRDDQMRDAGRHGRDFGRDHDDYHDWRGQQIAALDRDYDEYRQHNRTRFHSEFGQWRTQRQGQRDQMARAQEHQEVVGSDGQHIGTVDHVRDDRILLTKNDQDAGGRHHSIPSSWIESVGDKVTISKTADEAKRLWRDEENNGAMFGGGQRGATGQTEAREDGGTTLNRSFSGTY